MTPSPSLSLPGWGTDSGCSPEDSGSRLLRSRTVWGARGSAALLIPLLAPGRSSPGLLGQADSIFLARTFLSKGSRGPHSCSSECSGRGGRVGIRWVPREDGGDGGEELASPPTAPPAVGSGQAWPGSRGLHCPSSPCAGGGPVVVREVRAASVVQALGLESEEGGARGHWMLVRVAELRHLAHLRQPELPRGLLG